MRRAARRGSLVATLAFLLLAAACSGDGGTTSRPEEALRAELGVPPDAERVLVVSQSSHLDLNFLSTFDGYWESSVRDVIESALELLDADPRYRYSIAEIAWLRRYWDEHPEHRERMTRQAASGALRIVGGGVSSPDSLLPTGESLLRDFLLGIQWSREHLGVTPSAAWEPDSFGHAPTLPSLLEHLGLRAVGLARIDGVPVFATPIPGGIDAEPGSSAATLAAAGSADWVWRGPDGAEVIARWMPFGYGQGDNLDFSFPWNELAGLGVNWNSGPWTDASVTNERFAHHLEILDPLRRTPYTFLPVGIDFSWPKAKLLDYVDRWNAERYPTTGAWVVAATFDEYVRLLDAHRHELPVLESDLSPYWTGFYTTHPDLKRTARRAHEALTTAEMVGVAAASVGAPYPAETLDRGWDFSAFMNHHDAITGTTTQQALVENLDVWSSGSLEAGEEALAETLGALAGAVDTQALASDAAIVVFNPSAAERSDLVDVEVVLPSDTAAVAVIDPASGAPLPSQLLEPQPGAPQGRARLLFLAERVPGVGHKSFALRFDAPPATAAFAEASHVELSRAGVAVGDVADADTVVLASSRARITLTRSAGWCATSLRTADGQELFTGASGDVVAYFDAGGAYRIGAEVRRDWAERTSVCGGSTPHQIALVEQGPARVSVAVRTPNEAAVERIVRLGAGLDRVELEITALAPFGSSLVARFRGAFPGDELTMSVPFGEVTRPRRKLFDPTFWPLAEWADVGSPARDGGMWIASEGSRGLSVGADGTLEAMLTRNTFWDGLGPSGEDDRPHTARLSVGARSGASWQEGLVHRRGDDAHSPLRAAISGAHPGTLPATARWAGVDAANVEISALKAAADRGPDRILRLVRHSRERARVQVTTAFPGYAVWRANGLEDPLEPVADDAASFSVDLERSITTLRLVAGR